MKEKFETIKDWIITGLVAILFLLIPEGWEEDWDWL